MEDESSAVKLGETCAKFSELPPFQLGNIVAKLPLPPGAVSTLWNNDKGFLKTYLSEFYPFYNTGDAGYFDEHNNIFVMARTDDVINVAAHRLSTGEIEEVVMSSKDIVDCAVFGVADEMKGEVPIGLVVLTDNSSLPPNQLKSFLVELVRKQIGAFCCFKKVEIVKRLPKTRSGKTLRGLMKKMANGESYKVPPTIEDVSVIAEIKQTLQNMGYKCQDHSL